MILDQKEIFGVAGGECQCNWDIHKDGGLYGGWGLVDNICSAAACESACCSDGLWGRWSFYQNNTAVASGECSYKLSEAEQNMISLTKTWERYRVNHGIA
jgi:hypothetical protein